MDPMKFADWHLEKLFQSFDWKAAFYDPLHDQVEATTEEEIQDLARMETLIVNVEKLWGGTDTDRNYARMLSERYWRGTDMENMMAQIFQNKKYKIMNEANLKYLKDNVKYMGFGEVLSSGIEKEIGRGAAEFRLHFQGEINKKNTEAVLHFRKSDTSDMYFFNKYDVRVDKEKDGPALAQTFYINKGQGVTLKEAYNLLEGRSVYKELTDKQDQKYNAWVQLDFGAKDKNGNFERKQFHQNYGFDLKEALSYYPIKELGNPVDKEKLIKSLEKGNNQSVTMQYNGTETKVYIEANPQFKGISLFNGKMQSFSQKEKQEIMLKPEGAKKEKSENQTLDLSQTGGEKVKTQKKPKTDPSLAEKSNQLLPKKRNGSNKGLSV
ncbi:MAG: hypothetical protein ABWZ25_08790 [Chitinophagaceae bacterium]